MKSLPVLISTSMLTCFISVPIGALFASPVVLLLMGSNWGLQALPSLWILASTFGFPLAFFYGAPLYALAVHYYRPAWWVALLIGGGPFWIFAVDDLMDRSGGDSLLFLSYGVSVAVSHHFLLIHSGMTVFVPAAKTETDAASVTKPRGATRSGPH